MQTASSWLAKRKQQIATIEGESEGKRTKGEGAERKWHLKVALEVAWWGLIRIVNYGSTSSVWIYTTTNGVQYIISFAIIFCSVVPLEWKYKLHLHPQMMKYTMIG